ncbi:MAG: glycosyltransferase, partial [Planctomycetota bacterium]
MKISAVIPVLDEAARMEDCLVSLKRLDGDWETIVVDGGSSDRTVETARRAGADQVLAAVRGRGTQLRAGADAACGEAILFLHADTRLPEDAARQIEDTLAADRWAGGAFLVLHRS